MARRCKLKVKQRGGFFITVPMIPSAIASGALASAAGEGVKAVINATKRPPPAPVVRARGLNFGKKHKVGLKSKGKYGSYWGERGAGNMNIGAYPMITRPVLPYP